MSVANLKVGDRVMVDSIDNFGGPAHVIEIQDVPGLRCKVVMDNQNPKSPFWAFDQEVTPLIDSRIDTYAHIQTVQRFLGNVIGDLLRRQQVHDQSKLVSPEKEVFDEYTPKLAGSTYGSDEYKGYLAAMKPALDHHYAANSHHPEYYRWHCLACGGSFPGEKAPAGEVGNDTKRWCPRCCPNGSVIWECELMDRADRGIHGMSLLDVLEMLCDWKAATLRHNDGDIRKSIEINQKRFGYSDELKTILLNTLAIIEG